MMVAVVAGEELEAPAYSETFRGKVNRTELQSYFVTVPEGVKALEVGISGLSAGSQTRFLAFEPWGVPLESNVQHGCYSNFGTPAGNGCNPGVRAYADPRPGVWEIVVESRRTSSVLSNAFKLTPSCSAPRSTPPP